MAGLGGCPFAPGATGNVATEDVVYMLAGLDYFTGVNLEELVAAGDFITSVLGRPNRSRAACAILAKQNREKPKEKEKGEKSEEGSTMDG